MDGVIIDFKLKDTIGGSKLYKSLINKVLMSIPFPYRKTDEWRLFVCLKIENKRKRKWQKYRSVKKVKKLNKESWYQVEQF